MTARRHRVTVPSTKSANSTNGVSGTGSTACSTTAHARVNDVEHVSVQFGALGATDVPQGIDAAINERCTTTTNANKHASAGHRPRVGAGHVGSDRTPCIFIE